MGLLKLGQVYRYGRHYSDTNEFEDGLPNYFFATQTPGFSMALLEKGISPIPTVNKIGEKQVAAVLISSSPHKIGSESTPWQDVFDIGKGIIRYSGDNKTSEYTRLAPGNKILLDQFRIHTSPNSEERKTAVPVVFFERVEVNGRKKGNIRFQGVGILQCIELVTQFQKSIGYFTNYVFEFALLSLTCENDTLDWNWISARRGSDLSNTQANELAPKSFREWQEIGQPALGRRGGLSPIS